MESTSIRRDATILCVLAFTVYLICADGRPWVEAEPQFARSQYLVREGSPGSVQPFTSFDLQAPDGRFYDVHGLLNIVLHVPVALLDPIVQRVAGPRASEAARFLSALSGVVVNSLCVVVFYVLLRRLPVSRGAAVATALCFAFGTMLFPYSGNNYEGNIDLLVILVSASYFFRYLETRRGRALVVSGAFAGVAILGRETSVLLPVLIGLCVAIDAVRMRRVAPLGWFAAGLTPGVLLIGWYNFVRTGSIFETAISYRLRVGDYPQFSLAGPYGILGLTVSPGGSLFAYSPVLLLALLGLYQFWRRFPREAAFCAVYAALLVIVCGMLPQWFGHAGWGPRYTLPVIPFLLIPLAVWRESPHGRTTAARVLFGAVASWAVLIQLSGSLINWHARLPYLLRRPDLGESYPWSDLMFTVRSSQWWDALRTLWGNLRHMVAPDPAWVAVMDASSNLSATSRYTALSLDTWWNRLLFESGSATGVGVYLAVSVAIIIRCLVLLRRDLSPDRP